MKGQQALAMPLIWKIYYLLRFPIKIISLRVPILCKTAHLKIELKNEEGKEGKANLVVAAAPVRLFHMEYGSRRVVPYGIWLPSGCSIWNMAPVRLFHMEYGSRQIVPYGIWLRSSCSIWNMAPVRLFHMEHGPCQVMP